MEATSITVESVHDCCLSKLCIAPSAGCLWGSIDAGRKRPYEHLNTPTISKKNNSSKVEFSKSLNLLGEKTSYYSIVSNKSYLTYRKYSHVI
jgi:hypothetical protein